MDEPNNQEKINVNEEEKPTCHYKNVHSKVISFIKNSSLQSFLDFFNTSMSSEEFINMPDLH